MTDPIVSFVIPSYNGEGFIGETLRSIEAQTLRDWEAIVVDDGSSDGTRALIRDWPDPRVRLIERDQNGGPVLARNMGVAAARGRYIAGLDQDDLCLPDRIARQVAYLDRHRDVALLGTQAEQLRDGRVSAMHYPTHTTPDLIGWLSWIENPLVWSTVMIRADVAHRLDPFSRPDLVYAEDFDLYHRIAAFGRLARLDEPLVLYRQHAGGVSKRFVDTMRASATRALTEAHADVLGEDAGRLATLLVVHNMGGAAVPDRATLQTLGNGIARLQAAYLARHDPDRESRKLIRWETARRWAGIGRAALRSGSVGVGDVLAARPPHLGLGYAGLETLLWCGAIGAARRVRRRA
ncbi:MULTISPECIES: glycosyltransferase [unclassified Sphingomonas]|jgi:Glycosyl transferase family 2|uniref:glycosyltransferase family 2 protein n=2 Tax=Pseudomonadota TaxID=1224 RepID=UPI000E109146|nr:MULTISPECIES: glycosyltransferase [unclassified Sphingomonas]AXJ95606.1 glycosyltransferase family 2 protein [Sphingomonas sp. FARSPH]